MELTPEQGRVLACLVEKQLTTPQLYPLTDSALIAACNQSTSREPVVSYDLSTVRLAVRSLRELGLLRTVHRTGERSDKHQHLLDTALDLSAGQVALLAVLELRGAQTAAELRAHSERMHAFGAADQVEAELAALADRPEPLAAQLSRLPGRKEARWVSLLSADAPDGVAVHVSGPVPDGPQPVPGDLAHEVALLRSELEQVRTRLAALERERQLPPQ